MTECIKRLLLAPMFLCAAACGGSSGSGTPTSPTSIAPPAAAPSPPPISVTYTLEIGNASAPTATVQAVVPGSSQEARQLVLQEEIRATGGSATTVRRCQANTEAREMILAFTATGSVSPAAPVIHQTPIPLTVAHPIPPGAGGTISCTATITDERGGVSTIVRDLVFRAEQALPLASQCVANANTLCAHQGRFELQTTWRSPTGQTGPGTVMPASITDEGGAFYFLNPNNVEITVKVLNGCPTNQRFWVSAGGPTPWEVTVTAKDVRKGVIRQYRNPPGQVASPLEDRNAFATCP